MQTIFFLSPRHSIVLLILLTAALYGQVVGFDYINWDDGRYVADNFWIQAGINWLGIQYAFTSTDPFLMPLVRLLFMAEASLLGMDAGHFHLVNAGFHLANVYLLYLVVKAMTGNPWLGVMTAAVLALHPQHVEAVTWISERKEVMSAFFGLLSLWGYTLSVQRRQGGEESQRSADNAMAWSVLAFCGSLLCKPMWVTLPFLLLVLDYWPLARWQQGIGKLIWEKRLFFFLSLTFSLVTLATFSLDGAMASADSVPWEYRLTKVLTSYGGYLWKGIWPLNLSLYYPHPMGNVAASTLIFLSLLLVAMTVLAWWLRHRMPWILAGWLWYLGMLFPVSGLVEGGMPVGMTDRWSYIPHVGISLAILGTGVQLREKLRKNLAIFFLVLVVFWSFLTHQQLSTWQNSETVWQQVIRVFPQDGFAYWKLGRFHFLSQRPKEAVHYFRQATLYGMGNADYHINLWQALVENGEKKEADQQLVFLQQLLAGNTASLIRVGQVLLRGSNYEQAINFFQYAMQTQVGDKNTSYIRFHLALALFANGDRGQGEDVLKQLFVGPEEKIVARCQLARDFFQDDQSPRSEFKPMAMAVEAHCKGR